MGFITEKCDSIFKICFTPIGRQYIAEGKGDKLIVKYFAVGDSDSNYFVQKRLGEIVDITGVQEGERSFLQVEDINGKVEKVVTSGCIIPTMQTDIKYKISLSGDTSLTPRKLEPLRDYVCETNASCGKNNDVNDCSIYQHEPWGSDINHSVIADCYFYDFD